MTKENTNQLDSNKIKNYSAANDIIKKIKRQPTECEEIFVYHISHNGLLSRIYIKRNLFQLCNEMINNPILEGQRI